MRNIFEVILCLYIYSFLGWACESIYCSIGNKKITNRGFLSGPICPIYGFGALAIIYILRDLTNNVILLFLYGIMITSTVEFIGGYVLEKLFHTRWWDYSNKRFNIKGRVCLKNSTLFGVMCVIFMKIINPTINNFVKFIPNLILMIIIFFIDLSLTINAINKLNNKLKGLDDIIIGFSRIPDKILEEIKAKSILQRRLVNAYPNMKHNKRHKQLMYVKKIIKEKIK